MIFFITVLRALAACIITNSHYVGVYPTDLIANGGLFGDVIFFAVSGFCLTNVKNSFPKWYGKRLVRVFPAVFIISIIYILLGIHEFQPTLQGVIDSFILPVKYHFVLSIIILYIPFYIVMKVEKLRENIPAVAGITALVWLAIYIFVYDKSYYHIDTVREPMIRFLFFFAMLLGAYFKENLEKYRNKKSIISWILLPILFVAYFASKLIFSRVDSISDLQIVNQIILFVLLAVTFRCFMSIDGWLENLPKWIKAIITFVSGITLEIYLAQIGIIDKLNFLPFPLNWLLITGVIVLLAFILNKFSSLVQRPLLKLLNKDK
ncbi:MAG: acyltransferase [Clostridia bacterium]|nr:acyltransferase [Clostridia bacterium]